MKNLQDLFDHYRHSKPSKGKLGSATNFVIHVCKAFSVTRPEEITRERFEEIPEAIDKMFESSKEKATIDKSILAEMIGVYGPFDGLDKPLRKLLDDNDTNLRHFAFMALKFSSDKHPDSLLPFIEEYLLSDDHEMRHIAVAMMNKMFISGQKKILEPLITRLKNNGDLSFIKSISSGQEFHDPSFQDDFLMDANRQFSDWLQKEFNI